MIQESLRIAGRKVACDRHIDVHNPYTAEVVGTVPKASLDQVREAFAIGQAYRARLSRFERANILNKAAALVRERVGQIAALITAECGLCLKDSTYEAGRVADVLM
ncbi:MAG: aldehyde dehydrogenase family protein, partial [Rubrivivax sp.]